MDRFITFLLFILLIFGATGIFTMIRYLVRLKRKKIKLRLCPKRFLIKVFSLLIIATLMSIGSLYLLFPFSPIDNFFPTVDWAVHYNGSFKSYERIDTDVSATPILLASNKRNENELYIITIETKKTVLGQTKYYVNGSMCIIGDVWNKDKDSVDVIAEKCAYGIREFPDIWFGVIYPENRDKIRVNGKVPSLFNINFNGADYIFWCIKRDGADATVSFQ